MDDGFNCHGLVKSMVVRVCLHRIANGEAEKRKKLTPTIISMERFRASLSPSADKYVGYALR